MIELLLLCGWPWIAIGVGLCVAAVTAERDKQIPTDAHTPTGTPADQVKDHAA